MHATTLAISWVTYNQYWGQLTVNMRQFTMQSGIAVEDESDLGS